VCAKVTRDAALEVLFERYIEKDGDEEMGGVEVEEPTWGSGYPSDARCTTWLKRNVDPVFGWGNECRFSWGTVKDMLDVKGVAAKVEWPIDGDEGQRLTSYFGEGKGKDGDELGGWFGNSVEEVF
jgi:ribonuclease H2 subunit A